MTVEQISELIESLKVKGVLFDDGLTDTEVLQIERKFDINFPPDLKQFLQSAIPVSNGFYNWRHSLFSDEITAKIISQLKWPLDGMLFDIEHNVFWFDDWGAKPESLQEQFEIARRHFQSYPKLIPIYGHRYISSLPNKQGNPIYSVYQMDIIYYGFDLATYFSNEFHFFLSNTFEKPDGPLNEIEFWSEVVS